MAQWVWLVLLAAINLGAVAGALIARRRPSAKKLLRTMCVVYGTLGVFCLAEFAVGLFKAFGAVGGEAVDVSQKARLLAEGISEAMNSMALAVTAFLVPFVTSLVLFLKTKKPRTPSSPDEPKSTV